MNKWQHLTSKDQDWAAHADAGEDGADQESQRDLELVARCQHGDHAAFDELVARHRNRIYAMIRRMVHHEADAWDLSQEVFLKAWRALPRFEAKAKFSTWLYRISHNVVYDFMRRRKIEGSGEFNDEIFERERIDPAANTAPAIEAGPDTALDHAELRAKIEAALAKLSGEHREVVLLKDVQGLSYHEIAAAMNCQIGTVMSRLFYARKKLQALLHDEYEAR